MTRDNRSLMWAGIGLAVLLGAAAVVVLRADRTAELDPDSPEGVVQAYVTAVIDGDYEVAAGLVDVPTTDCFRQPDLDDFRVTLADVSVDGERAEVELTITEGVGEPPFDAYSYSSDVEFELRRDGDGWTITEVPWRFEICEETT